MKKNIFRVVKDENYTVISNIPLKDRNLSFKAKGLLAYILTLPDDWKLYIAELSQHSRDGRDGTASALRELIKAQYITRVKILDRGRFVGYEYSVYEMPAPLFHKIQEAKKEYFPDEKPKTAFPYTEKPKTEKPSLLNTNNTNILTKASTKKQHAPYGALPHGTAFLKAFSTWLDYKAERKQYYTPTGMKTLLAKCSKLPEDYLVKAIDRAVVAGYMGFIFDDSSKKQEYTAPKADTSVEAVYRAEYEAYQRGEPGAQAKAIMAKGVLPAGLSYQDFRARLRMKL